MEIRESGKLADQHLTKERTLKSKERTFKRTLPNLSDYQKSTIDETLFNHNMAYHIMAEQK